MVAIPLSYGSCYQLDFMTPGISPLRAKFRKQILHMSNFL
jgi:hypothetical protein